MPTYNSQEILFMTLASYIKFNNDTLLTSYPSICILLYIDFSLMMFFPNLLLNVYLVFLSKSSVMIKEIKP